MAQASNSQVVNLIVPLAPGGIADITGRPFAIPFAKELGQPVIVENRIGAGGAVGMSYASKQKADGNTLLLALSSIVIIPEADKVMGRPPSYSLNQFTPIALLSADPTVLVVRTGSTWKTIGDLVRDAKAKPKTLSFSSSGIYGTTHVAQAMLWQAAGVELLHVPYNGGGPSMAIAGRAGRHHRTGARHSRGTCQGRYRARAWHLGCRTTQKLARGPNPQRAGF